MKNIELILIQKIIQHASEAIEFVHGISYEQFVESRKDINAVTHSILQMGELSKKIELETRLAYHNIPWKEMSGTRDRIVHDYDGINLRLIWDIIQNDLPNLITNLQKIIQN